MLKKVIYRIFYVFLHRQNAKTDVIYEILYHFQLRRRTVSRLADTAQWGVSAGETGAGRTDAGVHARMMVAHFDASELDCEQLAYKLNRLLPQDIAVQKVETVDDEMHARFSAKWRTYHYYIHTCKDPFLRAYSCEIHYPLDFAAMNEAGRRLTDYDDFGAFCKSGADVKTTLCQVTRAAWIQTSPTTWYFEITANRFLRNMVRAVVGTMIDVGRGRLTIEEFCKVIEGKRRTEAGESMPGNALFLEKIEY